MEVKIKNPIKKTIEIKLHPDNKELGSRKIKVEDTVYLSGSDREFFDIGSVIRLKDLYNIRITKKISEQKLIVEIISDKMQPDIPRLQWVSEPVEVEIVKPEMLYLNNRINKDSLKYIQGLGESNLKELKVGEIIQLERFGYTKINNIEDKIKMNYIHG